MSSDAQQPGSGAIRDAASSYRSGFGVRLRVLRKARRLSLEALSARSGIAAVTLEELETSGDTPSLRTLERLSVGLSIPLALLLDD